MSRPSPADVRSRFRELHAAGTWAIPNPWDVGSARVLEHLGAVALATTSSGFAATLGRNDGGATLDDLVVHVGALTSNVSIPVNVDAERLFSDTTDGVVRSVKFLAVAGASGISIEDWNPATNTHDSVETAAERVGAAAEECNKHGIVLTARAENHIRGVQDLDDTIIRLRAYESAGAHCLYAPGLTNLADIERVVGSVGLPVNVLAMRGAPSIPELASVGVRRVSTGGSLAWAAYGALVRSAEELLGPGTYGYLDGVVSAQVRRAAFPG